MHVYRTWDDPCKDCTDRILPTKENPVSCHSLCERYKKAKRDYERSKKEIRKQKDADMEYEDFTINNIRRNR